MSSLSWKLGRMVRPLTRPRSANNLAIFAIGLAVLGFFLVENWVPALGFMYNLMEADIEFFGAEIRYRSVLFVAVIVLLWAAYLKFGKSYPN